MKKSAGIYLLSEDTGKALLLYRSKICPDPFTWGVVAGLVDEGESFEEAAKRELREELNYYEEIELTPFFEDLVLAQVWAHDGVLRAVYGNVQRR